MSEAKPGPELDALVAEKVMGWSFQTFEGIMAHVKHWYSTSPCPNEPMDESFVGRLPAYSTSIAHAWEVVERSVKLGWAPVAGKDNPDEPVWYAEFMRGEGEDTVCHCSYAPTAPHAICLAALKAAGE